MQRKRKLQIVLVVFGLGFGLALTEAALRYLRPQNTMASLEKDNPAMYRPSSLMPYELLPGFVGELRRPEFHNRIEINQHGQRDDELLARSPDRLRVLAIGDSFTFGWGVEGDETWANRLEAKLSARLERPVEVVNAGFAACYYPDTYYLYLREWGLDLEPDLIVIGFYVGNDIDHPFALENEWLEVDEHGLPRVIGNRDSKVDAGYWVPRDRPFRYAVPWLRESHVFQLVVQFIAARSPRTEDEATDGSPSEQSTAVPYNYRPSYDERTEQVVTRVKSLFTAIHGLAAARDLPIVVMMIPELHQVLVLDSREPNLAETYRKPQEIFSKFFTEQAIPYLDLLPMIEELEEPPSVYFPMDLHWNVAGHELAAVALTDFLVDTGIVSRREHDEHGENDDR